MAKIKLNAPSDPAITLQGIYLNDTFTGMRKSHVGEEIHGSIIIAKKLDADQMHSGPSVTQTLSMGDCDMGVDHRL